MRFVIAAALLLLPAATLARVDPPDGAMAKALQGLKPTGKAVSCVSLRDVPETRIIDETTIIYRASSSRAYVNHPPGGCPGLTPDHAISSRTPTDRICAGDIITVFDPVSRMNFGSCALGEFQPYGR